MISHVKWLRIVASALLSLTLVACVPRSSVRPTAADNLQGAPLWANHAGNSQQTASSNGLGPQKPSKLWEFKVNTYAPCVGADGTVYAHSPNTGLLYALNPQDGSVKWHIRVDDDSDTVAIGPTGMICIASSPGLLRVHDQVVAISPAGRKLWTFSAPHARSEDLMNPRLTRSLIVGPDGTAYVGTPDGWLYAIEPTAGRLKWQCQVTAPSSDSPEGSAISGLPAVSRDGTVYVCDDNGDLFAVSSGGHLKWSVHDSNGWCGPMVGADGTVYRLSSEGLLTAVNPGGTKKWRLAGLGANGIAMGSDGTIYASADGGGQCAVSLQGKKMWEVGGVAGAPVVARDGSIFVAGDNVWAVSRKGHIAWTLPIDANTEDSAVIGAARTLLVLTGEGHIVALGSRADQ